MKLTARTFLAALSLLAAPAAQATYPDKPVRIVLPFAAGGVADITARIVAEKLSDKLGQRFLVENQAGAGGITAARTVISSPPDGYTLALLSNGTAVSVLAVQEAAIRSAEGFRRDFEPRHFRFYLRGQRGCALQDAGRFRRGGEGKARYAQCRHHQCRQHAESFGRAVQDLGRHRFRDHPLSRHAGDPGWTVAGQCRADDRQLFLDERQYRQRQAARAGLLRTETLGGTPELPTAAEGGVAGYDVVSWNALFAPAATPPEIIKTLNDALKEILADADVKKRMLDLGIEARASTPQEISDRLKADIEKWGKVIDKAGIPKQ